ncbi:MAG: enoyl-CoA hydratase-related protein, partial [Patescibacteria group bacterium]|nr:enoyl-CoA hydratase-related protein [Patescibacteria group bacterium]
SARVILLRAQPEASVWCAGHDLGELRQGADPCDLTSPLFRLVEKIQNVPAPVIAVLEGDAYAGGVLLLMAADLVVATKSVQLVMTGNRIGVPFPPAIYRYWLSVFGLHRVKELFLTARPMPARDAHSAGIINRVCRSDQLESTVAELTTSILACSPEGIADTKRQLNLLASQTGLSQAEQAIIDSARRHIYESDTFATRLAAYRAGVEK